MPSSLSAAEVIEYQDRGFHCPVDGLSNAEAAAALTNFIELEERLGGDPKPVHMTNLHLNFRWAYDLVTHPKVLDGVEGVLGPDLLVWSASIYPKKPRSRSFVSWHQDGSRWGFDLADATTAWIAFTDSTRDNGCLRVIPGSHKLDAQPHLDTHGDDNLVARGQELAVEVDEDEAVDLVLRQGQFSMHHMNIFHGSDPNASNGRRVGLAVRYISTRVRQINDGSLKHKTLLLARGTDRYGHFDSTVGPPPAKSPDEAYAAHAEVVRQLTGK